MSKKMCEICHKNPATVPDRERMGRPINRICGECHAKRLKMDIVSSMTEQIKRREQPMDDGTTSRIKIWTTSSATSSNTSAGPGARTITFKTA